MSIKTVSPMSRGSSPTNTAEGDPSNITPTNRTQGHRYSSFDTRLFTSYNRGSPSQAKRALEAHIADTDRRIQDASKLGTTLLEQKKQLTERLKDVEKQQGANEVGPELKQKLVELEKEFNEVGRESARAFIPKPHKFSIDNGDVVTTPSVVSGDGRPTATKSQVPSRKQRNQPSSRVHDIEFATEISTSLLAQVRHLQSILAEKEEALKKANVENSQLQAEAEGFGHRLRGLYDNEQKLKDENWSLETQVQDLTVQVQEAASHDHRLTQHLNAAKSSKAEVEREYEELRQSHEKLSEDHASIHRNHDVELSGMRRNIEAGGEECETLRKKVEELTSQNQDLARAVAYRVKTENEPKDHEESVEGDAMGLDQTSPEHSPPPSPTKGTPRHGVLESETLKSSLHHAHRMIQNLKNNIHREKTEKVELKRMLQDARDEVELKRAGGDVAAANAGRKRKPNAQQDVFKKPSRPDKLGDAKAPHEEILNDPSWELYDESPSRDRMFRKGDAYDLSTDTGDGFQTANEQSSIATDTDAFQTAESFAGDTSDDLTEIEGGKAMRRQILALSVRKPGERLSFQSTASDDNDQYDLSTPTQEAQQYRLGVNRGGYHKSSGKSSIKDSPVSFVSDQSQPRLSQNLATELEDLGGEDTSVADSTPGRSIGSRDVTPNLQRKRDTIIHSPLVPAAKSRPEMVDSSTLTDPWEPQHELSDAAAMEGTATAVGLAVVVPSFAQWQRQQGLLSSTVPKSNTSSIEISSFQHPAHDPSSSKLPFETSPDDIQGLPTSDRHFMPLQMSSISSQHIEPVTSEPSAGLESIRVPTTPVFAEAGMPPVSSPATTLSYLSGSTAVSPHTMALANSFTRDNSRGTSSATYRSPNMADLYSIPVSAADRTTDRPAAPTTGDPMEMSWSHVDATSPIAPTSAPITAGTSEIPRVHATILNPIGSQPAPIGEAALENPKPQIDPVASSNEPVPSLFTISIPGRELKPRKQPSKQLDTDSQSNKNILSSSINQTVGNEGGSLKNDEDIIEPVLRISRSEDRGESFQEPTLQLEDPYGEEFGNVSPSQARLSSLRSLRSSMEMMSRNASRVRLGQDTNSTSVSASRTTTDEGTQTMVSADQMETLLKERNSRPIPTSAQGALGSPMPRTSNSDRRAMFVGGKAQDQFSLVDPAMFKPAHRSGSAGGLRAGAASPRPTVPPLPADHREVIAAAASRSSSMLGNMPPPTFPTSAYKPQNQYLRPTTPNGTFRPSPSRMSNTPRNRTMSLTGRTDVLSRSSRRSSVSSFASELDERFNINLMNNRSSQAVDGFDINNTDPRMIQAITQTMIGEYLWKYTRKAGRGKHSENRHKRFFWIHPYTRTLYWSNQDPSAAGMKELKAKSVSIEAVRVITDNNPIPQGLHQKSIVVVTPGRNIKFTAPTSQRHEAWFNALSYLLLRNGPEREAEIAEQAQQYTNYSNTSGGRHERANTIESYNSDDISEFNPNYHGRSASRMTVGSQRSMSSVGTNRTSSKIPPQPTHRTASPQGYASARSLAVRQSQAAQKRSITPIALSSNPISSIAEAEQSRQVSQHEEPGVRDNPAPPESEFKRPRPLSTSAQSTKAQGDGRRKSLTSRFRPPSSLFRRSKKANRLSQVESINSKGEESPDAKTSTGTKTSMDGKPSTEAKTSTEAKSSTEARASTEVTTSTEDWKNGYGHANDQIENVRACCDGERSASVQLLFIKKWC